MVHSLMRGTDNFDLSTLPLGVRGNDDEKTTCFGTM
jgi:hypothetical protein